MAPIMGDNGNPVFLSPYWTIFPIFHTACSSNRVSGVKAYNWHFYGSKMIALQHMLQYTHIIALLDTLVAYTKHLQIYMKFMN